MHVDKNAEDQLNSKSQDEVQIMRTLKYDMKVTALEGVTNDATAKQYKTKINEFAEWAKNEFKIRCSHEVEDPEALIKRYCDCLIEKNYTPSTIHTYLAPVCKGLRVTMAQIDNKPKRTAGQIIKTRNPDKNIRGQIDAQNPKNDRVLRAQKCIGVRKSELMKLRGDALTTDVNGEMCVKVINGKGGKNQMQVILPNDREFITQLFSGLGSEDRVFTKAEKTGTAHISLHSIRAEHAREAYTYYEKIAKSPEGRQQLKEKLFNTFREYHGKARFSSAFQNFQRDMLSGNGRYVLRGENKERAIAAGRPIDYDRVALMCVSVWHLSHWRCDVTVKNYML